MGVEASNLLHIVALDNVSQIIFFSGRNTILSILNEFAVYG